MKTYDRPRCRKHSLFQPGACRDCSYPLTQVALVIDQADTQVRNRRGPIDGQTGDSTTL